MIRKIMCFFGYHKWINLNKEPYPTPKENETIAISDLHECEYCKKQQYLGMGFIS